MTDAAELLQHIRVLESQAENNKEVVAALRELEENLIVRIDDALARPPRWSKPQGYQCAGRQARFAVAAACARVRG